MSRKEPLYRTVWLCWNSATKPLLAPVTHGHRPPFVYSNEIFSSKQFQKEPLSLFPYSICLELSLPYQVEYRENSTLSCPKYSGIYNEGCSRLRSTVTILLHSVLIP